MAQSAPRIVLDVRNIVGESIIWSPDENALYWVDIVGQHIHRLDPDSGEHMQWPTPELPTSIGLRHGGGFVVGLRQRVALWSPGARFETLAVPEPNEPANRLNEGVVAPDGSFWVGTMLDNIADDGSPKDAPGKRGHLYRIDADGNVGRLSQEAFGITNTMIWGDDGTFVTADTASNSIFRFDYDARYHQLSSPRLLEPLSRGLPDGSDRDSDGNIYNCRVAGGAAIAVLQPDGSQHYIDLPCSSPTSCTFGGKHLDTLYVTSARFGMSQATLERSPHEGALMAVALKATGKVAHKFGKAP